jgi:hypothetical protein
MGLPIYQRIKGAPPANQGRLGQRSASLPGPHLRGTGATRLLALSFRLSAFSYQLSVVARDCRFETGNMHLEPCLSTVIRVRCDVKSHTFTYANQHTRTRDK